MQHHIHDVDGLRRKANSIRIQTLELLAPAPSGHVGGALGMADIFTAVYYWFANTDPKNPNWEDRDYVLLSNGHICPVWYAVLGDLGFYDSEERQHLREVGHLLQGHPKLGIPGVENSSGPLGHGLSQAIGIAYAMKMKQQKNRVICLMSDGEHQEGQTWEAVMSAPKWKLNNLIAIMDKNGLQIEGTTDEIMPLGDLEAKYVSFDWHVRTIDGHDMTAIMDALTWADSNPGPTMIIANTILGKGVSFMEDKWQYHDWKGKPEEAQRGIAELQQS